MIAVGAPVHYYTQNKSEQHNGAGVGPYAAVITQILRRNPDAESTYGDYVNLKVFPPFAPPYDAGSVEHRDAAFYGMTGAELPGRWFEEVTLQVVKESEVAIVGLDEALAAFK